LFKACLDGRCQAADTDAVCDQLDEGIGGISALGENELPDLSKKLQLTCIIKQAANIQRLLGELF